MKSLSVCFVVVLFLFSAETAFSQLNDSFTIVYNNVPSDNNLKTQWGYAVWIKNGDNVILFDTGTKSGLLMENFEKLGLNPAQIKVIAISHEHQDHTGGLESVLNHVKDETKVYVPYNFKSPLKKDHKRLKFITNDKYIEIENGIWLTHVFVDHKRGIKEQALVIEKMDKVIMITGCAHPGIVDMCSSVKKQFPEKNLELVTGGFHLMQMSKEEVAEISDNIKTMGFKNVGPTHCTGDNAIEVFKKEWKENFVQLNLGDTYRF